MLQSTRKGRNTIESKLLWRFWNLLPLQSHFSHQTISLPESSFPLTSSRKTSDPGSSYSRHAHRCTLRSDTGWAEFSCFLCDFKIVAPRVPCFLTAGQGERRLCERDCSSEGSEGDQTLNGQSWKTIAHVTNSHGKTGKHITKMAEFLKTWKGPMYFTSDKTYVDQISLFIYFISFAQRNTLIIT